MSMYLLPLAWTLRESESKTYALGKRIFWKIKRTCFYMKQIILNVTEAKSYVLEK